MVALKKPLDAVEPQMRSVDLVLTETAAAPRLATDDAVTALSPARLLQGDLADRLAIPARRSTRRLIGLAAVGIAATAYCAWMWFSLIRWLMDVRPGG